MIYTNNKKIAFILIASADDTLFKFNSRIYFIISN